MDQAVSEIALSVVIPLYNEEDNVAPLCDALLAALVPLGRSFEIILVNDGSRDGTEARLAEAAKRDPRIRVLNFRSNKGQTAAMMAGIDYAAGEVIVPMDGDLQNDPKDIGRLLAKLEEGYEVVSGWRRDRQDSYMIRTFPSKIANWVISRASGVKLHDYGCSLKAYRREVLRGFRLYGEMHRFIPIYAAAQGARVAEIPVSHHARKFGQSKYGLNRTIKVLLDLLVVKFLTKYRTKPIYLFGQAGVGLLILAFLAGLWAIYLKLFHGTSFIQTPLPLLVSLCIISGLMCLLMGLLAELIMRVYYESQGKADYRVKSVLNPREGAAANDTAGSSAIE
ncbi:MAG: glycosyltransferase family 2 protein [Rhodospirillaceae bacterium]|nr:glycosyltransferase family 2 protein [Rhodospirillaceae bacterium]MCE7897373.1 glycosyltransferase [Gammaproteobacteria bacterium PRO8]